MNISSRKFFKHFRSIIIRTFLFDILSNNLVRNFFEYIGSKIFGDISGQKFFKYFRSKIVRTFRFEKFSNLGLMFLNISDRRFFQHSGQKIFHTLRVEKISPYNVRKILNIECSKNLRPKVLESFSARNTPKNFNPK